MCDPTGVHITRIYVSGSRQSPSPIRPSNTFPVCTSTPINNVGPCHPSPKQQMALVAKEILKAHRSTDPFVQKPEPPKQQKPVFIPKEVSPTKPSSETFIQKPKSPKHKEYAFISKETGQKIDFNTGEGIGKLANLNTGETVTKKKKSRQSLAIVPPTQSGRSSKSSDDGDYLVPMTNDVPSSSSKEKKKINFTSYDGIQMFTFTLDDD